MFLRVQVACLLQFEVVALVVNLSLRFPPHCARAARHFHVFLPLLLTNLSISFTLCLCFSPEMSDAVKGNEKKDDAPRTPPPRPNPTSLDQDLADVKRDIAKVSGWIDEARADYKTAKDKLAKSSTAEERRRDESALAAAERELAGHRQQLLALEETRRTILAQGNIAKLGPAQQITQRQPRAAAAPAGGRSGAATASRLKVIPLAPARRSQEFELDVPSSLAELNVLISQKLNSFAFKLYYFPNDDGLEKLTEATYRNLRRLQRSVIVVKEPQVIMCKDKMDGETGVVDDSVISATNEEVADFMPARSTAGGSQQSGSPVPSPRSETPSLAPSSTSSEQSGSKTLKPPPLFMSNYNPFPKQGFDHVRLRASPVATEAAAAGAGAAAGAETKSASAFVVPYDAERMEGEQRRDYTRMFRLWKPEGSSCYDISKPLEIGENLEVRKGMVLAPSAEVGWNGISLYCDQGELLKEYGPLPADVYVYSASTADLLNVEGIQLLQDPTEPTHFGLCPTKDIDIDDFEDILELFVARRFVLCGADVTQPVVPEVDEQAGEESG